MAHLKTGPWDCTAARVTAETGGNLLDQMVLFLNLCLNIERQSQRAPEMRVRTKVMGEMF